MLVISNVSAASIVSSVSVCCVNKVKKKRKKKKRIGKVVTRSSICLLWIGHTDSCMAFAASLVTSMTSMSYI